ncbi:MAG: hypothetical protein Q7T18_00365 [Sedimentisphaerales bacterium]|nr:hypothetical protein [Sedimentisphaerales bacterium]
MFEHHSEPLLPRRLFAVRIIGHAALAIAVILLALAIGMFGYHYLEGLAWLDSFLNAAMILGGMGPVDELHYPAAKLFAGIYALFSGLVFIGVASIIVLPVAHRLLHTLHLDGRQKR